MSRFLDAYMEAVEFTDCHCDNPELQDADRFSDEFLAECKADCDDFQELAADDLAEAYDEHDYTEEQAGHDFWLTRNGHGAGFWDRGLGALGNRLTKHAKSFGSVDLYAGDDNLIYGG